MDVPARTRTYVTPIFDSTRWDRFRLRPGDIVVCTPVKSGTTWTQMLCALLVHQSPSFPQPLNRLSRWLERNREPVEEIVASYEAQPHRRIIKSHTPIDGLPYDPAVSYVFCGRDPRDVFFSMCDQIRNGSEETLEDVRRRAGLPDDFELPDDPNQLFALWLTTPYAEGLEDGFPMGSALSQAAGFWRFRHVPNLLFLHYADLSADLDAEARRLAAFLGVPVDERLWPSLLAAASFTAMRARADDLAPGAHYAEWRSNRDFFRQARRGGWQELLNSENQALYEGIAVARLGTRLKSWLEGGRAAAGEPRAD
ncbi:MAG: sulfotransferase domain-containing protein [Deltaproteobacteria bacterium]|nr:sulfotransferase domain-containing protein [Deltaproteobacteria bacterium]